MLLSGSQIVMEELLAHGVDTAFGYPGGAALNLYDALYEYRDRIRHIMSAHEQGACHAADGYARSGGKTGVVFATSGPGATNLVTGIATAWMDSVPLVAITANVASNLIGRDAFQEIYITGITMPITKHNFLVSDPADIADVLRDAFRIAHSGRKGPVLVDITKDATIGLSEYRPRPPETLPEPLCIDPADTARVAALIDSAEQPVFYCGGGVIASDSTRWVRNIAAKAQIPVCHSMMGAGVIPHDDPLNLGMVGMHGTVAANLAVDRCDLLLAVGVRFPDRVALNPGKFAHSAKIIHIDADRSELNKNVKVEMALRCDLKQALSAIAEKVKGSLHPKWLEEIRGWQEECAFLPAADDALEPRSLIERISKLSGPEAIYVTDVGQHQMWAAQFLHHTEPKRFITSGGLGTMGFGYGAAIGAQLANPGKRIVHLTGDGSFHMNLNEGCTAVSYELPIITVIFNNKVLGMVYQWQSQFYGQRYSATVPERKTDFVRMAEAFGAKGYSADTLPEFEECYRKALSEKGPVWIDCAIDKDARVLPMIPGGGTVEDMITE
ncbi:MAG TPA: biosynthetic-type acetolactate synthase large subunit [Bacillota bacterium]|nr:biosynthetic-type acetolactate synthase large subunit [Bacillota bacterium]